jgi:hypothetical protein
VIGPELLLFLSGGLVVVLVVVLVLVFRRGAGRRATGSFGVKTTWVAFREVPPERLAHELGLRLTPCRWWEGVDRAYTGMGAFLTPPVGGWTLLLGSDLSGIEGTASAGDAVESLFRTAEGWSARLGTSVQCFGTHRVTEAHAWGCFDRGRRVRTFRYEGDRAEGREEGPRTPVEEELRLGRRIDVALRGAQVDPSDVVDEADVLRVAAAWSVDPSALGEKVPAPAAGWIVALPRS